MGAACTTMRLSTAWNWRVNRLNTKTKIGIYRDDFWHFEHNGWDKAAKRYDIVWAGLTRQFVTALLDAVGPVRGARLLDIACGPGYAAEAARARGAVALGVDFSEQMISGAREGHPGLEFSTADAHALPFQDESFDAVVCNFGLPHFSRPQIALAEAFRVLRHGGQFAFTVWAEATDNPRRRIMADAIEAHAETNLEVPRGPSKFRFTESDETRHVLWEAGFIPSSVHFSTIRTEWQVPSAGFWFDAERYGSVRTAAVLAHQTPSRLAAIRAALARAVQAYACPQGYAIPAVAHIVAASAEKG